jgi:hypothetical protein
MMDVSTRQKRDMERIIHQGQSIDISPQDAIVVANAISAFQLRSTGNTTAKQVSLSLTRLTFSPLSSTTTTTSTTLFSKSNNTATTTTRNNNHNKNKNNTPTTTSTILLQTFTTPQEDLQLCRERYMELGRSLSLFQSLERLRLTIYDDVGNDMISPFLEGVASGYSTRSTTTTTTTTTTMTSNNNNNNTTNETATPSSSNHHLFFFVVVVI